VSLGLFIEAFGSYRVRIGARPNWRRILVNLGTPQGTALLYASLPPLVCLAGLVTSTSRGAILAVATTAPVVLVSRRRRDAALFLGALLAFAGMALGAYGLERLEARFDAAGRDRGARVAVWRDALQRMGGYWLRGSGLNTFAWANSRAVPFEMPTGATPWPRELLTPPRSHERDWPAFRVPPGTPGSVWYREAHNDYLQLLVETGVPGLLTALWGATRVLRAARPDPWLLASLLALLAHESVDFDLQIPAIAVLFASLSGLRPLTERA
jgi:O-antigen ligase